MSGEWPKNPLSSQRFGAGPSLKLMNFWSLASFFNRPSPLAAVTSVSCQVKHDRAVFPSLLQPSDLLSLIYSCQRSSEEHRALFNTTCLDNRKLNHPQIHTHSLAKPLKLFFFFFFEYHLHVFVLTTSMHSNALRRHSVGECGVYQYGVF